MSSAWDDFDDATAANKAKGSKRRAKRDDNYRVESDRDTRDRSACDWGQSGVGEGSNPNCEPGYEDGGPSKFIQIYEQYLRDKRSILQQTANYKTYGGNPQKELREWFENLDETEAKFAPQVEQIANSNEYVCTLDLPIDEHEFTITSGEHGRRKEALDEVCLDACRMLDASGLLYAWQCGQPSQEEVLARKERVSEALKEDDIVFDQTAGRERKRHCPGGDGASSLASASASTSTSSGRVNTYESLMAKWRELNMSILSLKAKLVKLDLSVTKRGGPHEAPPSSDKTKCMRPSSCASDTGKPPGTVNADANEGPNDGNADDDDDEPDPLDEFMSTLETKTKLSMDDKIEKSRIKSQIASYEREQSECARLISIAKPGGATKA